ncbi:hypothetical protein [Lactococcus lactis]|nr:hypothetical protein [Lactococcus lactis]AUS69149.1 hypothetical protein LLG50_03365 [Lactococcus lactis subsp. lactis]MCG1001725.1 hypothetical protein [Lactococcus lactis]MCM6841232.1 hypothetical protein [Lactococcus lactis]MCM6847775.1 hypothetical protein [Lactococcus lactis]MCM6851896.1 hypothetical protein [Lactococcus lactis]
MAEIKINLIQVTERDGVLNPILQVTDGKKGMVMLTGLLMMISEMSNVTLDKTLEEIKVLAPQIEENIKKNESI